MKKTSTYARKRRRLGPVVQFNGAAWMNTIAAVRSYDEGDAPAGIESSKSAADQCETMARMALQGLLDARTPLDPEHDHDVLAHALGVTVIRALQIQPLDNPLLPVLHAGTEALKRSVRRHRDSGAWGLDGPGRQALTEAVDVYAQVLRASSPAQMAKATDERMKILRSKTHAPLTKRTT